MLKPLAATLCLFPLLASAAEYKSLDPPEGAVVLFQGGEESRDASKWQRPKLNDDGYLLAGVTSKDKFQSAVIHLEFNVPPRPEGKRNAGNSGVYIQRRYEIQVLNTPKGKPSKGGCAAIYQYKPADSNQTREPGQWQQYVIFFQAPQWEGKKKVKSARITLFHNGVKVHDDVEVTRKTGHGRPEGPDPLELHLQNHGFRVAYRNIWVLPFEQGDDPRVKALLEQLEAHQAEQQAAAKEDKP